MTTSNDCTIEQLQADLADIAAALDAADEELRIPDCLKGPLGHLVAIRRGEWEAVLQVGLAFRRFELAKLEWQVRAAGPDCGVNANGSCPQAASCGSGCGGIAPPADGC